MVSIKRSIGAKLAASSGIVVLLVAGMAANQLLSNRKISQANMDAAAEQAIVADAIDAKASIRGMMVGVRDLRLAQTQEEAQKAFEFVQARRQSADKYSESVLTSVKSSAGREGMQMIKTRLVEIAKAIDDLRGARMSFFALHQNRNDALARWNKAYEPLAKSIAGNDQQDALASALNHADNLFKDARIASWRYLSVGEKSQFDRTIKSTDGAISGVKKARLVNSDKSAAPAFDALDAALADFRGSFSDTGKAVDLAAAVVRERTLPMFADIAERIDRIVASAKQSATEALETARQEMALAERVSLAGSLFIVAALIGSAAYCFVGIGRPLRRLNGGMQDMANGNLAVVISGADRSDEIGDIARTISVIRGNAEREAMEKQEADHRNQVRLEAERREAMQALADSFERAVGGIIETVSSASTELEAAAGTLTRTAETTQSLAGTVAAASEEASANVQSVASATNEMASSVNEISRQVQESSRIAGEAVKQADKTDGRITELSQAASRIGDVVKLITAIAEQTNLLALNATIEAARAGEAGKGFAVVAQEVKALAAQTGKATGEIGSQISAMQTATQDSVAAIKEIGGTINRIAEIAASIAAAIEEQGAATGEIARNVQQAAQGTTQVASNITEVNRGAGETGSASSQVLSSAQSLAGESNRLKSEVAKFLQTIRAA